MATTCSHAWALRLADKAAPRSVSSASSGSMEGLLGSAGGLSS